MIYDEKLKVHCKCGNVYVTSLDSLILASIPPIHQERGRDKCKQCGVRYIYNHKQYNTPIIRDVFVE